MQIFASNMKGRKTRGLYSIESERYVYGRAQYLKLKERIVAHAYVFYQD